MLSRVGEHHSPRLHSTKAYRLVSSRVCVSRNLAAHTRDISGIIQANLIHLSINMATRHESGAPFLSKRVFQNRVTLRVSVLSLSPPSCCVAFLLSPRSEYGKGSSNVWERLIRRPSGDPLIVSDRLFKESRYCPMRLAREARGAIHERLIPSTKAANKEINGKQRREKTGEEERPARLPWKFNAGLDFIASV